MMVGGSGATDGDVRFPAERLKPGVGPLRSWQLDALAITLKAISNEPVLIEACPGAGKTRFGLEVAYRLATAGRISRVIVVVPTVAIADGWATACSASAADNPTLPLRTQREWQSSEQIGDRWLGVITTYQSLFASTEAFLTHASEGGHRTLVIFDEVHHAGAEATP